MLVKKLKKLSNLLALSMLVLQSSDRSSSEPYISGDSFRSLADCVYDEFNKHIDTEALRHGDIVFIKTDYLEDFIRTIFPLITKKIILITHNSDLMVPGSIHKECFIEFLNSDTIIALFTQNLDNINHHKLYAIPIGLANREWEHGNIEIFTTVLNNINNNKPFLVYLNISPSTYPTERIPVYNYFKNKRFCTVSSPKKLKNYLEEMAKHTFTLSPRGNGLDCHRTWEALLVGSIPIVKTSSLDSLYKDLPVLIINDWHEITEPFLLQKYQEIRAKTFNYNKVFFSYWKHEILGLKDKAISLTT